MSLHPLPNLPQQGGRQEEHTKHKEFSFLELTLGTLSTETHHTAVTVTTHTHFLLSLYSESLSPGHHTIITSSHPSLLEAVVGVIGNKVCVPVPTDDTQSLPCTLTQPGHLSALFTPPCVSYASTVYFTVSGHS